MINRVILVGRLVKDPMKRMTTSGKTTASFTIAVSRKFKSTDPNAPTADFINCVAWSQAADFLCNYLHKGSLISVEGRIQTRNYDDPNNPGKKVYVTEVVCDSIESLESKGANEAHQSASVSGYYPDDNMEEMVEEKPTLDIALDNLPF